MRPLLFSLALALLAGCTSQNTLFEEHQSVGEELEWSANEPLSFAIDIKENKHPYELALAVRCASGYPYDKLMLHVTETNPQGESVRRDLEVPIRDAKGDFYGEKGFDIIDIEYVIDSGKEFPTFGQYTYTLEAAMPEIDPVVYIMELGLVLRDIHK
jgi:gliding motility-associated lipoprotein GldH